MIDDETGFHGLGGHIVRRVGRSLRFAAFAGDGRGEFQKTGVAAVEGPDLESFVDGDPQRAEFDGRAGGRAQFLAACSR